MIRRRRFALAALALVCALLPARPAAAAWAHDPAVNTPVAVGVFARGEPVSIPDGAGGMFVAWSDARSGVYDIYVQHIDAAGRKLWGASDVLVCGAALNQNTPVICSDYAGGVVVAWIDFRNGGGTDLYARRVNSAGVPQWTADGVLVCNAASDQNSLSISPDRAGGCLLAWRDIRAGNYDVYAAWVQGSGSLPWTANGVPICTLASTQYAPQVLYVPYSFWTYVVWQDARTDAGDIYLQRLDSNGNIGSPANGLGIVVAANEEREPVIVEDNTSGFLVAWIDNRSGAGTQDLYAQRFDGSAAPVWASPGAILCSAAGTASQPSIVSDGQSGAIVAWMDTRSANADIFARRVSAAGIPQWAVDGVALCTQSSIQQFPKLAPDGLGGAVVTWQDFRYLQANDVFAQRISFGGVLQWTADGLAVTTAANSQNSPQIVTDGAGGAIITFIDFRGNYQNIYAQRVDRWGYLGAEPTIANVRDVPNDQGGLVKVSWNASPLDVDQAFYNVAEYLVFRSAPPNVVESALKRGAVTTSADEVAAGVGAKLLATPFAATTYYWEFVERQSAYHLPTYSLLAPTPGDSVGGSNPRTAFLVMARNAGGTQFWSSEPDSGYSVDNLAPAPPAPFTGQYQGAVTRLHWDPNSEPDIAGYRLYRGSSPSFTPGPANLVASPADTGYADAIGSPYYYKLSAVDSHGNESAHSLLTPSGTTGVIPEFVGTLGLEPPRPNPAHGSASIEYMLSRDGDAQLAIVDVSGRIVRELARGQHTKGFHAARWEGTDAKGHPVAAGVYFFRLAAEGRVLMRRMAFVR